MSLSKSRLETSIRQYLVPHLKEDAFGGSGRTFRRVRGEWVQVVNVQGARHDGSFAINLGVHPLSIPDISGNAPDPHKILEPSCELRRRLSESGVDQWWHHDSSQFSMDQAVSDAAEAYVRVGRPLLASITGAVSTLHTFTPLDLENLRGRLFGFGTTQTRLALLFARIRKADGKIEESKSFANWGLAHVGPALFLRNQLTKLALGQ